MDVLCAFSRIATLGSVAHFPGQLGWDALLSWHVNFISMQEKYYVVLLPGLVTLTKQIHLHIKLLWVPLF